MRRMAEGTPIGLSLVLSFGSLCKQNKYVSVKKCRAVCGMLPW